MLHPKSILETVESCYRCIDVRIVVGTGRNDPIGFIPVSPVDGRNFKANNTPTEPRLEEEGSERVTREEEIRWQIIGDEERRPRE